MQDVLSMIGNVGFPITVSIYLLIRIENKLGELTNAINNLREAIITMPREKFSATVYSNSEFQSGKRETPR